jgi:hypothetical protein
MLDFNTVAMSPDAVLSIRRKDLVVFDARTRREASTRAGLFTAYDRCDFVRGGRPAFVACERPGELKLLRIDDPAGPVIDERTFPRNDDRRKIGEATHDAPIVIGHRCNGDAALGSFCVRQWEGSWVDFAPPPDPYGLLGNVVSIQEVAADVDGTPFGFAREERTDDLIIVDGRANDVTRIPRAEVPALDPKALWETSFTVIHGEPHFLFPGERPGVLIRRRDGGLDARTLTGHMASIGRRALLVTEDGALRETLDGGETFHDVPSPPGGADPTPLECEEGGCLVGPWLRLGWGP